MKLLTCHSGRGFSRAFNIDPDNAGWLAIEDLLWDASPDGVTQIDPYEFSALYAQPFPHPSEWVPFLERTR